MRIKNVANIEELDCDLTGYGPGTIALCGGNGAGKSHFLESLFTALLFREWVSSPKSGTKNSKQGESFIDHCWNGEGSIIGNIDYHGHKYELTLRANPTLNKQEAYFVRDGESLNPSGKISEYDELVGKFFPPKEYILSVPVASQNNLGSFFNLDRESRRTLFARLLNVEEYEQTATFATEHARKLSTEINELDTAVRDLDLSIQQLDAKVEEMELLEKEIFIESNTLSELRDISQKNNILLRMNKETYDSVLQFKTPIPTIEIIPDVDEKLAELRRFIEDRETQLQPLIERLKILEEEKTELVSGYEKHELIAEKLSFGKYEKEKAHERCSVALVTQRETAYKTTTALNYVDLRLAICKRCPLTGNAQYSQKQIVLLNELISLEKQSLFWQLDNFREQEIENQKILIDINNATDRYYTSLKLRRREIESLEEEINVAKQESNRLVRYQNIFNEIAYKIQERSETVAWCVDVFIMWYEHLKQEQAELLASIKQLDLSHSFKASKIKTINEDRQQRLKFKEQHEALSAKLEILAAEVEANTTLADILLYMRATRISRARPSIEETANELLEAYQDGRFKLFLMTTSTTRGSSKEKEDFIPKIYDTKYGVYKNRGSGGEQAIFDEVLRLAICIENARHYGIKFETLVRDETTAHVTSDHASDYLAILKRAREIGEFYQIIFVSHHAATWPQADAIIEMQDGKII